MEQEIKNQLEFLNEEIAKEIHSLQVIIEGNDNVTLCANHIISSSNTLRRLLVQFELLKQIQFSATQKHK